MYDTLIAHAVGVVIEDYLERCSNWVDMHGHCDLNMFPFELFMRLEFLVISINVVLESIPV